MKAAYVEASVEIESHTRSYQEYSVKGIFIWIFKIFLIKILENELTTDLAEYVFYCEAIHELIKRYEVVQFRQEQIEAKKSNLEKEKYEIESGGGKTFSVKGVTRALLGGGEHQKLQRLNK